MGKTVNSFEQAGPVHVRRNSRPFLSVVAQESYSTCHCWRLGDKVRQWLKFSESVTAYLSFPGHVLVILGRDFLYKDLEDLMYFSRP